MKNKEEVIEQNPFYDLKKKLQKKDPSFTDSVDGLNIEDLKKNILILSAYREETAHFLKTNEEIKSAKEIVAELTASPNETLRILKDKLTYIHSLITEKKTE